MDIEEIPFEIAAIIGTTTLPITAYLELQIGDILLLEQEVTKPIHVKVGEQDHFLGRPGLNETRKAITIHERIHP